MLQVYLVSSIFQLPSGGSCGPGWSIRDPDICWPTQGKTDICRPFSILKLVQSDISQVHEQDEKIQQDWARTHSGDPEIEASLRRGDDPGLSLVSSLI